MVSPGLLDKHETPVDEFLGASPAYHAPLYELVKGLITGAQGGLHVILQRVNEVRPGNLQPK